MQILNDLAAFLTYTILLIAYCLAGRVRRTQYMYEAVKLVGACRYHVLAYSNIIKVSVVAKMSHFEWDIQEETISAGVRPTAVTWSSLVSDCATEDLEECAIHPVDKVILLGYEPPWNRYNTSTAYNPVHDVASSYGTGAATNVHVRLALGYTSVIILDADMYFRTLQAMGLLPNVVTVLEGLCTDGCCTALQFADGQGVF
ncbi:pentatricopeptide repeat-containing protein At5g02830, chloroplastic-like [Aristolochia californica]|uniref:pentatricopeptide repeat-containing protein At5g02830, chloroplastic-like n=1 Tax=Aristolochia californica TaxID=171875 RepID=UPI0035E2E452